MRSRTVALLMGVALLLGAIVGIVVQRVLSARSKPPAEEGIATTSCAFLEPIRVKFLFNCDRMTSDTAAFCDASPTERATMRSLVEGDVTRVAEVWAEELRSSQLVDRLESGEIQFSPELAQRTYDTMFGAVSYGRMPKAEPGTDGVRGITKRGFIESLKCLPHTWASIMLSSIPSLTDLDLRELQARLPHEVVKLRADLQQRLSSLKAAQ